MELEFSGNVVREIKGPIFLMERGDFDFGVVKQSGPFQKAEFKIKNVGSETAVIKELPIILQLHERRDGQKRNRSRRRSDADGNF